jgi:hypothetical protein
MSRLLRAAVAAAILGSSALATAQEPAPEVKELTGGGLAMMIASNLFVWTLAIWCFRRVLKQEDGPES